MWFIIIGVVVLGIICSRIQYHHGIGYALVFCSCVLVLFFGILYLSSDVACPKCEGSGKFSRYIDKKCGGVTQCGGEILGRCVSGVIKPVLDCVDIGSKCQGNKIFAEEIMDNWYGSRNDLIRKKYCQETVCSICNGTGVNGKIEEEYDDNYCKGQEK